MNEEPRVHFAADEANDQVRGPTTATMPQEDTCIGRPAAADPRDAAPRGTIDNPPDASLRTPQRRRPGRSAASPGQPCPGRQPESRALQPRASASGTTDHSTWPLASETKMAGRRRGRERQESVCEPFDVPGPICRFERRLPYPLAVDQRTSNERTRLDQADRIVASRPSLSDLVTGSERSTEAGDIGLPRVRFSRWSWCPMFVSTTSNKASPNGAKPPADRRGQ